MEDNEFLYIRDSLGRIERTLIRRWMIFILIWITIALTAVAEYLHYRALNYVKDITLQADARSVKNEALIDAAIKQQVIYQQQLSQYMDYLDKKNPKIKVPRVIVTPPASPIPSATPTETPPPIMLSEDQLTRNNKVAKPEVVKKTSTRKTPKKPSPTPGPFERFFKPRSTR